MLNKYFHDDCLRACAWLIAKQPEIYAEYQRIRSAGQWFNMSTEVGKFQADFMALNDVASAWACGERTAPRGSVTRARQLILAMEADREKI
jgi:hypothetical protein